MQPTSIINPGTGPVEEASALNAIENMTHFIVDHKEEPGLEFIRAPGLDYGEGRFAFLLYKRSATRYHEIQMPGIPLDQVRYVHSEGQNIWNFPRLYIDGSSWVWQYALLDGENDWNEPG